MGNERGGEAADIFFGLIESAKANGLNTYAYFRYIMTQMPLINQHNKETFLDLLPHRVDQSILQKYLIYFFVGIALRLRISLAFLSLLYSCGILPFDCIKTLNASLGDAGGFK
jgi:IS66 C-terminal element